MDNHNGTVNIDFYIDKVGSTISSNLWRQLARAIDEWSWTSYKAPSISNYLCFDKVKFSIEKFIINFVFTSMNSCRLPPIECGNSFKALKDSLFSISKTSKLAIINCKKEFVLKNLNWSSLISWMKLGKLLKPFDIFGHSQVLPTRYGQWYLIKET